MFAIVLHRKFVLFMIHFCHSVAMIHTLLPPHQRQTIDLRGPPCCLHSPEALCVKNVAYIWKVISIILFH